MIYLLPRTRSRQRNSFVGLKCFSFYLCTNCCCSPMGNNPGKKGKTEAHEEEIDELFLRLSRHSSTINLSKLKEFWSPQLDPHLCYIIEAYLSREYGNEINKENFIHFFVGLNKVDAEEKSKNILSLINGSEQVSKKELFLFITSVISSLLILQENRDVKSIKSWSGRMLNRCDDSVSLYGKYFLNIIDRNDKNERFNADDIRQLLMHIDVYLSVVMSSLYGIKEIELYSYLMPTWKDCPLETGKSLEAISVLDMVKIMFINSELPIDYQHEWRLLFSSSIDGESFSRFTGQVILTGATVIIIKDKGGHVFGGFAPASWKMGPNFTGDSSSFLFTLLPEMNLFTSTGFNSNFQYLNVGQQTMPNGLGMGGKLGYFGLWLSAEFGSGCCSESCTTYRNYRTMSSTKEFSIEHLEVWGVGPPPPTAAELGERSVLDGNIEAKAILEMAGKTTYSDGLREEPKD